MRARPLCLGLLIWAAIGSPALVSLHSSPAAAMAQEAVRPEVGKPLAAASNLMRSGKHREALAKTREADAVGGKSAYESFVVDRMMGFAAASAGDAQTAAKALQSAMDSGKMSGSEKLTAMEALVSAYYRAKDFKGAAAWADRYTRAGGTNAQITGLSAQLRYMSGDSAGAARELNAQVAGDIKAGRKPSEEKLQLLANAYLNQKNTDGYLATLEKLVTYYPKPSYWTDVISRVSRKTGFADRLALEVYRLKFATNNMASVEDYMQMAQLAMQEGFNAEGKKVVEKGFAANVLGQGTQAERQKRLLDLANKRVATEAATFAQLEKEANASADGSLLVNLGMSLVGAGQTAKGIAMMEQGIQKGGLKRPEDSKLRLGIAYLMAGQKPKAVQMLKTVQGKDGTADVARLWTLHAQQH